jgi:cytochrome c peroxidase
MPRRIFRGFFAGFLLAAAGCGRWADRLSCAEAGCEWTALEWERLASLADRPNAHAAGMGPVPTDPTNRFADDPQVARLGQSFYFDPGFSGPSRQVDSLRRPALTGRSPVDQPANVSCASCHDLLRGGTDVSSIPGHVSVGAGLTDVNALPTLNAARRRSLFWNGRMQSAWGLNALVGESETTMNGSRLQTAHRLRAEYGQVVQDLFVPLVLPGDWREQVRLLPPRGKPGKPNADRPCDPTDSSEPEGDAYDCMEGADQDLIDRLFVLWAKALAAYGRLLESRDSALDRFIAEGSGSGQLPGSAQRGARLFVGKAGCIDCHSGPLLTDEGFHNLGVPQIGPGVPTVADCVPLSSCDCLSGKSCLPWGRLWGVAWQTDEATARLRELIAEHSDGPSADPAPPPIADERLKGAWRTPSLRDVALTAPYMHDGAYGTLEEVLWHYNSGGRAVTAPTVGVPSVKLKPLGLSPDEVSDLLAFLKTLTGAPLPQELGGPAGAPGSGS